MLFHIDDSNLFPDVVSLAITSLYTFEPGPRFVRDYDGRLFEYRPSLPFVEPESVSEALWHQKSKNAPAENQDDLTERAAQAPRRHVSRWGLNSDLMHGAWPGRTIALVVSSTCYLRPEEANRLAAWLSLPKEAIQEHSLVTETRPPYFAVPNSSLGM